ncbi:phosphate signaling complex protein PhoU [Nocardia sp. NPDC020380]|uniref:phosphate signaling complex protein PhoU n=1 Tax=Nocardia sp. NPDC020380 TaxID=3364309 RepID=UPI00378BC336
MRTRFHDNLDELATRLHAMCVLDRTAVATATQALLDADLEQAQNAITLCGRIAEMRECNEHAAVTLLALQAPVASELRQVVSALQLVADLARMGGLAGHIARVARMRHPARTVPESVRPIVARMGAAAIAMATSAAAVLASRDPDEATHLCAQDDLMDELHRGLLDAVAAPEWTDGVTPAVDLALLAGYYERFADHAVRVGHRTIFIATGHSPDRLTTRLSA